MWSHQRVRAATLALLLAAAPALSCGGGGGGRPDLLLITIDTTRADHIGTYGDEQAQTAAIDQLARRGVLFARANSQIPLTAPSHSSMMTGFYPSYHGVRKNGGFAIDPAFDTLAEILADAGYTTAGFMSSFALNGRYGFSQGFETWDDIDAGKEFVVAVEVGGQEADRLVYPERHSSKTVDSAVQWLKKAGRGPVFLWVHLYDAHTPYKPPKPYDEIYANDSYRGEIASMDRQIDRLLEAFDARRGTPLIALLSDHGEGLGERREMTHGFLLYENTQAISFIISYPPKLPQGEIRWDLAETVDLLPTLVSLCGVPWSIPVQGHDLSDASAQTDSINHTETLYGKMQYRWSDLRGIRYDDWMYIHGSRPELFNLALDPGETVNRYADEPQLAGRLHAELQRIVAEKPDLPDTAGMVEVTQEEAEALAALGYVGAARIVRDRNSLDVELGVGFDPSLALPYAARYNKAQNFWFESKWDSVVAIAHEVGRAADAGPVVRLAAGVLLYKMNKNEEALAIFDGIRQDVPDYPDAYVNMGAAEIALSRLEPAKKVLREALELDPQSPMGNYNLARILADEGDLDGAMECLQIAVDQDPGKLDAHLLLAKVYVQKGFIQDAHKAALAILRIDPDLKEALDIRLFLEKAYPEVRRNLLPDQAG